MKIDKNKCIGCGACVSICPNVFALKDGKATVISKEECSDAVDACPVAAITG